jgi:hypothetical protein
MQAVVPEAKLIYIVRDPIERIISEISHKEYARGKSLSAEITSLPEPQTIANSRYALQLSRYLQHFSRSQIHVLQTEELRARPTETMQDLFRFLNAAADFDSPVFRQHRHRSDEKAQKNVVGRFLSRNFKKNAYKKMLQSRLSDSFNRLYVRISRTRSPVHKPILHPEVKSALMHELGEDIQRFFELTGASPDRWPSIRTL